jgi:hypothetical protein
MKEQNQEKEFERLLKEKWEGFELKPSDEVWQNVSSSLKRDRRRIIFWWSMAAMLAVAIGTGAYFIVQNEKSVSNKSQVAVSNSSETKNSPETNQNSINREPVNSSTQKSQNKEILSEEKNDATGSKVNKKTSNSKHVSATSFSNSKKNEQLVPKRMPSSNYEQREVDEISRLSLQKSSIDYANNEELSSIKQKGIATNSSVSLVENVMAHHFTVEADGMWAITYSRNSQSADIVSPVIQTPPSNNSFWNTKGFSAGGNFLFYPEKKWFFGSGIHFTKTNTQVVLADQVVPQYDTTFLPLNNLDIDTSLVTIQPSNKFLQQWLDVSLMAGVNLSPDSKNHLRLLGGIAYSRLLSAKSQPESGNSPGTYDTAFSGNGGTVNVAPQPQSFAFEKNQVQVFTEVAYVRDLGSHFSISAGGQLHYYPMNLLQENSVKQHMMWVGLKGGVSYSF